MPIDSCLVDTNILLRLSRRADPNYSLIAASLTKLASQSALLHYTHQNIAELWNAMTRPIERNGLGLTPDEARQEVEAIEFGMTLLPDSEAIYKEWRKLIVQHAISGVQVHDARLAASMYVHGVTHILTLNTPDFARFTSVVALHPASI